VELVQEGEPDRALDELHEGLQLVAVLLHEAPTDLTARLQLGFIYKTFTQVAAEMGNGDDAADYANKADAIFEYVRRDVVGDQTTVLELAETIHGQGNIEHTRGNLHAALARYREALQVYPDHPYALHDIFAAHLDLAKTEPPNSTEMRWVLDHLKAIGAVGMPGLGAKHIAEMEHAISELESRTSPNT
jgi:tetratricopeptide (TPR) repeat protein